MGARKGGTCKKPVLESVLDSRVLGISGQRILLELRYAYGDGRARPTEHCRGTGERIFKIANRPGAYQVTEMTGQRRMRGLVIPLP